MIPQPESVLFLLPESSHPDQFNTGLGGERGRNRTFNLLIKSQSSALLSCYRDTP